MVFPLPSMPPSARLRGARRARWVARSVAVLPAALGLLADLWRRPNHMATFDAPHAAGYAATALLSMCFWTTLVVAAAGRRGLTRYVAGALFLAAFTLTFGVQSAFHAFYNIYLSIDAVLHSHTFVGSLVGELPLTQPGVALRLVGAFVASVALLVAARRWVRPRRSARRMAVGVVPVGVLAVLLVPVSYRQVQSTPPDLLYLHGLTALAKERLGIRRDARLFGWRRASEVVPPLRRRPARPRNVVLILQESQRADVTCVEFDPRCDKATRASNAAAPGRLPLLQMRANASATANSLLVLWTGLRPTESGALIHSAPLLWEYAAAAGYDNAYWTSQHLLYGNARLMVQDAPISHRCSATQLDPGADLYVGARDALLTDRVISEWAQLREPFFAVVHYSNNHIPYVFDPAHAPFQPSEHADDPAKNEEFKNFYRNVVYLSDLAVGRLIEHLRATEIGRRTVLVYTADHGEAFREHGQIGHSTSIYDEELRVPMWIDAPPGVLSEDEVQHIKGARSDLLWHVDVTPTLLDLMGLWDEPALQPFRARMMGHPITRSVRTTEPVPITNCTAIWDCAFRDWGMMQGSRKIEAREWGDDQYRCFDVLEDPAEQRSLGEAACAPLPELARKLYGAMPSDVPAGKKLPAWVTRLAGDKP
jgi:glucan phosphoethanolaminetransferase (alkaline phosphatase superfamily)